MTGSSLGKEEEEEGKGGEEGHKRDPTREAGARPKGPAFPAASFPCSWPAEQSGHLSFPCRFWSIVLLPLSLSPSSPPLLAAPQPAAVAADVIFDGIFCLRLLIWTNSRRGREYRSCETHGGEEEEEQRRRSDANPR